MLRHLRGQVVVLLDNLPVHKGEPTEDLQRQHPRLHGEYFPAFAPELNPDEGGLVSSEDEFGQRLCKDMDELTEDVMRAVDVIKNRRRSYGLALRRARHSGERAISLSKKYRIAAKAHFQSASGLET